MKKGTLAGLVLGAAIGAFGCGGDCKCPSPSQPEEPIVIPVTPVYGNDLSVAVSTKSYEPEPGTVFNGAWGTPGRMLVIYSLTLHTNKETWSHSCGVKRDDGNVFLDYTAETTWRDIDDVQASCELWFWEGNRGSPDGVYEWAKGHEIVPFLAFGDKEMNTKGVVGIGSEGPGINMQHVRVFHEFDTHYKVE